MKNRHLSASEESAREARRVLAVGIPSMVLIPLGIYFGFMVLSGSLSNPAAHNTHDAATTLDTAGKRASLTP